MSHSQMAQSFKQDIKNTYPIASITKRCSGGFSTASNPSDFDFEKYCGLYKKDNQETHHI
jgi:hypothetical protein